MNKDSMSATQARSSCAEETQSPTISPFHLAIPVSDLTASRKFYGELFGCKEGRSDTTWVDFDFFGHQLVCHVDKEKVAQRISNPVDGHDVPVPHFGIILTIDRWRELADQLTQNNVEFIIEPYIRFEGQPGEQGTMFLNDPSGNALEFKGFRDLSNLFAK